MLKPRRGRRAVRSRKALAASLTAYPGQILLAAAIPGAVALSQAPRLAFDFNPLNLQAPRK